MEQKILKVGDVIELKGKKYRAEPEVEKCTCTGCDLYDDGECLCGDRFPCGGHLIFKEVKETPRRYIELGVVKVEGDKVTFRIVEQTHRCGDFSQQIDPNIFKASNGVELRSISVPEWEGDGSRLFCRGNFRDSDNNELTCTVTKFARVCEAVTEYNSTNGMGYEKPWPQWDDRYFFVSEHGKVDSTCFEEREFDYNLKEIGNFFRTSQEAEAAADKIKALLKELAAK